MRISDWSSDVCSSDLDKIRREPTATGRGTRARWYGRYGGMPSHASRGRSTQRPGQAERQLGRRLLLDHQRPVAVRAGPDGDRSEEHTSELQSLMRISYAVFCLKQKTKKKIQN